MPTLRKGKRDFGRAAAAGSAAASPEMARISAPSVLVAARCGGAVARDGAVLTRLARISRGWRGRSRGQTAPTTAPSHLDRRCTTNRRRSRTASADRESLAQNARIPPGGVFAGSGIILSGRGCALGPRRRWMPCGGQLRRGSWLSGSGRQNAAGDQLRHGCRRDRTGKAEPLMPSSGNSALWA